MKLIILIFAVMAGISILAESEYRIFTDTEGRAIEARIMSCDARSGKVTVERTNNRKITVASTIFSEADQAYIKEWNSAQGFLSNSKFRISVQKKKGKTGNDKSQTKRSKPPCHYEIQLDNRSGTLFTDLRVECCTYVSTENLGSGKDKLNVMHDRENKIQVADRGRHVVKTKEIELFRYYRSVTDTDVDQYSHTTYSTSYSKTNEDDIEGIRIRVYLQTPSGNTFMREIYEPKSIAKKHEWKGN